MAARLLIGAAACESGNRARDVAINRRLQVAQSAEQKGCAALASVNIAARSPIQQLHVVLGQSEGASFPFQPITKAAKGVQFDAFDELCISSDRTELRTEELGSKSFCAWVLLAKGLGSLLYQTTTSARARPIFKALLMEAPKWETRSVIRHPMGDREQHIRLVSLPASPRTLVSGRTLECCFVSHSSRWLRWPKPRSLACSLESKFRGVY